MHARFYVPGVKLDSTAILSPEEAHHLVRVMRLREGDSIQVFDGHGNEFLATIESATREIVVVRPTKAVEAAPEPAVRLTLALGVTKGEGTDTAVRDAAMLGASAVQPLVTAHTETTVGALTRAKRVDRWRRIAVSSSKQCGRAVVPTICEPLTLADYLRRETADLKLLLVEPRASQSSKLASASTPESAALLIGPEGGWTDDEIDAARRAGFHPITLGQRTLRADAMPIAAIAVLQFIWGDL